MVGRDSVEPERERIARLDGVSPYQAVSEPHGTLQAPHLTIPRTLLRLTPIIVKLHQTLLRLLGAGLCRAQLGLQLAKTFDQQRLGLTYRFCAVRHSPSALAA